MDFLVWRHLAMFPWLYVSISAVVVPDVLEPPCTFKVPGACTPADSSLNRNQTLLQALKSTTKMLYAGSCSIKQRTPPPQSPQRQYATRSFLWVVPPSLSIMPVLFKTIPTIRYTVILQCLACHLTIIRQCSHRALSSTLEGRCGCRLLTPSVLKLE